MQKSTLQLVALAVVAVSLVCLTSAQHCTVGTCVGPVRKTFQDTTTCAGEPSTITPLTDGETLGECQPSSDSSYKYECATDGNFVYTQYNDASCGAVGLIQTYATSVCVISTFGRSFTTLCSVNDTGLTVPPAPQPSNAPLDPIINEQCFSPGNCTSETVTPVVTYTFYSDSSCDTPLKSYVLYNFTLGACYAQGDANNWVRHRCDANYSSSDYFQNGQCSGTPYQIKSASKACTQYLVKREMQWQSYSCGEAEIPDENPSAPSSATRAVFSLLLASLGVALAVISL
jgi:hypothetical protein